MSDAQKDHSSLALGCALAPQETDAGRLLETLKLEVTGRHNFWLYGVCARYP